MYRIEFIDNCNKLRNKWFVNLSMCDLEVYNFVVGIYDENNGLLDKKYLILSDLERSFYGKLSQVAANYLIDNIVTQPVKRIFFDNSKLLQIGNNYIESYLTKSVTPVYNDNTQLLNFLESWQLNIGYRYCKKISFSLEFQQSVFMFDNLDLHIQIFLGNVEVSLFRISKETVEDQVYSRIVELGDDGFINTNFHQIRMNCSGSYKAGGLPALDLKFYLLPILF